MSKPWDILGIGNAAVDELIYLDRFPTPDTKLPIRSTQRQGGGLTATALVAAARQGARAAFCSLIGYDELSTFTLEDLEREGVDCSPCFRAAEGVPYHSFILVEGAGHTRTILYTPGRVEPPVEHITAELIGGCKVLFIDHHAPEAGLRAIKFARDLGIPVVSDIESDKIPHLDEILAGVDHLISSAGMAEKITGKTDIEAMVRALAGPGRACAAVTAGEHGCWYSAYGGPVRHQPTFWVDVVDTTGCGDVFHGAYAAAIARGESIDQAIAIATATAAIKAGKPGGRAGIPTLAAGRQFLRDQHEPRSL